MEGETFDVIIVGASIAGCTAATLFGRRGLTVALLDRVQDPAAYKKICTHYIQPSANGTLRRLGLEEAMRAKGAVPNATEVWTPYGWMPWAEGNEAGYNLRREVFDPMLRNLAASTPGVQLMLGHSVSQVIEERGRVVGVIAKRQDADERVLRGRLVVAADGRHGKLGTLAGVPARQSPNARCCYFAYYEGLTLASGMGSLFWFGERETAYCVPNDANLTLAVVMARKDKLDMFREDPERALVAMFDPLPNAPCLRAARRVSDVLGMVEMPNFTRPAAARGMAFVGDAALTSDPMFGVGCGWALQSAEWLADIVGPALERRGDLTAALARYRKEHAARLGEHHALIASASTGRPFNLLERVLFEACTRDEVVASVTQRFLGRVLSPKDALTPGLLLRALWVNLTKKTRSAEGPRAHPAVAAPA